MQDHCNAGSTSGALNGGDPSGHKPQGELLRCECCNALLIDFWASLQVRAQTRLVLTHNLSRIDSISWVNSPQLGPV
jgi:hypothetical protein